MAGWIFLISILGMLVALSVAEIRRYLRARTGRLELDYPRRRLIRRLGISLLMIVVLLAIRFGPRDFSSIVVFSWYGACFAATMLILLLAMRDLHETSVSVLSEHRRLRGEAEEELHSSVLGDSTPPENPRSPRPPR